MSWILRILLIAVSVVATTTVISKIRRAKMQIEDAVFWVLFSFLLILLSICPPLLYFFTGLLKMQSPANLLFLVIIALLFMKIFSMSLKMSLIEEKLSTLAQEMALRALEETERSTAKEGAESAEGRRVSDGRRKC